MYPMVSFGPYELSAAALLGGFLIYLVVSATAIVLIPKLAVEERFDDASLETAAKVIDLRGKVRQSVVQFFGGVAIISTFILAVQQIRQGEDAFKQKKAELYSKSMAGLLAASANDPSWPEAMFGLSFVARSDPSYHRVVFDALTNHVRMRSPRICSQTEGKVTEAHQGDAQIEVAMRLIGEREPAHDPTGKRFNLERACLAGVDVRDEKGVIGGLRNARLSNAIMLRSDFTNVDLTDAELMGVWAADYLHEKYDAAAGLQIYQAEKGDHRFGRNYLDGDRRRRLVANFVGATLVRTNFEGARLAGANFAWADLAGANFRYAGIARANFINAKNLHKDQFKDSCVGRPDYPDELDDQQPYFTERDRELIGKIALCGR